MSSTAPTDGHADKWQEERSLHHVGFVINSITESVQDFADSLSGTWDGVVTFDPLQKVHVAFLRPGRQGDPSLELIEPVGEDSPVNAFLRRGGGLHHLCFEVSDLEDALKRTRDSGGLMVRPPLPATAFAGRRIAWVYTRSRLLLEYLEK
jgi:methylmalonyl-CoA/ethylmalonyl-CoA epimerase